MPITVARAQAHVDRWAKAFERFSTSNWPANLFHAAQLEVAVEILRSGKIICREEQDSLVCDVANQGALLNNPVAHKYARLYFRPKNSYHLKTEGIKSLEDPNRIDPHMSIPVFFVFDFVKTLTTQEAYFTKGNFATSHAKVLDGDTSFDELDFDLIYHDSAPGSRMAEIHNWRMSEVVVPRQLTLSCLSRIICRTPHEERLLRYKLECAGLPQPLISVEQRGSIFLRKAIFVDEIYLKDGILHLNFHAPVYSQREKYCVKLIAVGTDFYLEETYNVANGRWAFTKFIVPSQAIWQVFIEECLAYEGHVPSTSGVIF